MYKIDEIMVKILVNNEEDIFPSDIFKEFFNSKFKEWDETKREYAIKELCEEMMREGVVVSDVCNEIVRISREMGILSESTIRNYCKPEFKNKEMIKRRLGKKKNG